MIFKPTTQTFTPMQPFNFDTYAERFNNIGLSNLIRNLNKDIRFSVIPYCYFNSSYWGIEDKYVMGTIKEHFYSKKKDLDTYGNYLDYDPDINPQVDITNLHHTGPVYKVIVPEYTNVIKMCCGIKQNIDKKRLKIAGIIGVPFFNNDREQIGDHFVAYVLEHGVLHYFDINGNNKDDLQSSSTCNFQFTIICSALRQAFNFEYFDFCCNKICMIPETELEYSNGNIYQNSLINSWNVWFINKKLHNSSLFDIDKQFENQFNDKKICLWKLSANLKETINNYIKFAITRVI
jgi:hypothetical protein